MRPRHRHEQRRSRRHAPSTLTNRQAFTMAEGELLAEARIYELVPTAAARDRAEYLFARAGDLRRRRERIR